MVDNIYTITSTGFSDDSSVSRVISKSLAKLPSTTAPPSVPVVSKGAVDVGGGAIVTNNLTDLTVWSGSGFDESGGQASYTTYINVDGENDVISTTGTTRGPDIVSNDKNLAYDPGDGTEPVMQAFFNVDTLEEYGELGSSISDINSTDGGLSKSLSGIVYFPDPNPNTNDTYILNSSDFISGTKETLDSVDYDQYKVDSNCPDVGGSYETNCTEIEFFSTTDAYIIGTPDNPVTVVAGDILKTNAKIVVFGILLAKNGFELTGDVTVFGGVVSLGDADLGGGPRIYLDKTIISKTPISSDFGPIRSSWKDW